MVIVVGMEKRKKNIGPTCWVENFRLPNPFIFVWVILN